MYILKQEDAQIYGVNWIGPMPMDDDIDPVEVPPMSTMLFNQQYSELAALARSTIQYLTE